MEKKRSLVVKIVACVSVLICAVVLLNSGMAFAQRDPMNLNVRTSIESASYQALRERALMVSVIKDGEVVKQTEAAFNANVGFALAPGIYDLRFEGDGMQTLVKRGIRIIAGEKSEIIGGPMRVGQGVKIVEYATGGLSREEIAARLAKLEAALAELQKTRR